jgi:hypothetical protein
MSKRLLDWFTYLKVEQENSHAPIQDAFQKLICASSDNEQLRVLLIQMKAEHTVIMQYVHELIVFFNEHVITPMVEEPTRISSEHVLRSLVIITMMSNAFKYTTLVSAMSQYITKLKLMCTICMGIGQSKTNNVDYQLITARSMTFIKLATDFSNASHKFIDTFSTKVNNNDTADLMDIAKRRQLITDFENTLYKGAADAAGHGDEKVVN